jgi:hypothetical protein
MSTSYNVFARIHSLPPAKRMPSSLFPQVVPSAARDLRQPQSRRAVSHAAAFFALPKEPEDARITGGTRSLERRLLALNLTGSRFWRESGSRDLMLAS